MSPTSRWLYNNFSNYLIVLLILKYMFVLLLKLKTYMLIFRETVRPSFPKQWRAKYLLFVTRG